MFKNTLLLLLVSTLILSSCGKDDDPPIEVFDYPILLEGTGLERGTIEVWTKTNGSLVTVDLNDTEIDERTIFTTGFDTEDYDISSFLFSSETEATIAISGVEYAATYTYYDNELNFSYTANNLPLLLKAVGTPESLVIPSLIFVDVDPDGSFNPSYTGSVSSLERIGLTEQGAKNNIAEGGYLGIMNFTANYE